MSTKFKPGDRVRYTGADYETSYARSLMGKVGTVVERAGGANVRVEFDGVGYGLLPGNLELVFSADHAATHEVIEFEIPEEPPAGSVVLDSNGTAWQRQPDYTDRWLRCSAAEVFGQALKWAHLVAESRKLTVIYRASEAA